MYRDSRSNPYKIVNTRDSSSWRDHGADYGRPTYKSRDYDDSTKYSRSHEPVYKMRDASRYSSERTRSEAQHRESRVSSYNRSSDPYSSTIRRTYHHSSGGGSNHHRLIPSTSSSTFSKRHHSPERNLMTPPPPPALSSSSSSSAIRNPILASMHRISSSKHASDRYHHHSSDLRIIKRPSSRPFSTTFASSSNSSSNPGILRSSRGLSRFSGRGFRGIISTGRRGFRGSTYGLRSFTRDIPFKTSRIRSNVDTDDHASSGSEAENLEVADLQEEDPDADADEIKDELNEFAVKGDPNKRRKYIVLICPVCKVKELTFKGYEYHLLSKTHTYRLHNKVLTQKKILNSLRIKQRQFQRRLEIQQHITTSEPTNFCKLCKLIFRTTTTAHYASVAHRRLKQYIVPYCRTCEIKFGDTITYESHLCSIKHIKNVQEGHKSGNSHDNSDTDHVEKCDSNKTVSKAAVEDKQSAAAPAAAAAAEEKPKTVETIDDADKDIAIGIEHIRKVEANFCGICKRYLSRGKPEDYPRIISKHCKTRNHIQKYYMSIGTDELKREAETVQRKELSEKAKKQEDETVDASSMTEIKVQVPEEDVPNIKEDENDETNLENETDDAYSYDEEI